MKGARTFFVTVILGRPKGRKSSRVKLTGREADILRLLKRGLSKTRIARRNTGQAARRRLSARETRALP